MLDGAQLSVFARLSACMHAVIVDRWELSCSMATASTYTQDYRGFQHLCIKTDVVHLPVAMSTCNAFPNASLAITMPSASQCCRLHPCSGQQRLRVGRQLLPQHVCRQQLGRGRAQAQAGALVAGSDEQAGHACVGKVGTASGHHWFVVFPDLTLSTDLCANQLA